MTPDPALTIKKVHRNSVFIGYAYVACGAVGVVGPLTGFPMGWFHWVAIVVAVLIGFVELHYGKCLLKTREACWMKRLAWNQVLATFFLLIILASMLFEDPRVLLNQMDAQRVQEIEQATAQMGITPEEFVRFATKLTVAMCSVIIFIFQGLIVKSYFKAYRSYKNLK